MCWQGRLRFLAHSYDRVVVVCRPGHEVLYRDFAHEVQPYPYQIGHDTVVAKCRGFQFHETVTPQPGDERILPQTILAYYRRGLPLAEQPSEFRDQRFVKLGTRHPDGCDLLVHARSTRKQGSEHRNWSLDKWARFMSHFIDLRIGSIGSPEGAWYVPGTADLRTHSLEESCNHLASACVLVGPSSGPIPLAALCGCPHVTWFGLNKSARDAVRYKECWNPFGTPCEVLYRPRWDPDVEWVVAATRRLLDDSVLQLQPPVPGPTVRARQAGDEPGPQGDPAGVVLHRLRRPARPLQAG